MVIRVKNKIIMAKKISTPIDREFDQFYKAYPIHRGRRDAEKAWRRLSAKDRRAARDGIARYCAICQQQGVSYKYPQGYLNGRRWEDEGEESQEKVSSFQFFDERSGKAERQVSSNGAQPNLKPETCQPDTPPDNLPDMAIW